MKKRLFSFVLSMVLLVSMAPLSLAAETGGAEPLLKSFETGISHELTSVGRYRNWAGVSSVSQFTDEKGHFCFAVDEEDAVQIYTTDYGKIIKTITIKKPYELFGGAACGSDGSLFLVWGNPNETNDTSVNTILVSKYTSGGKLVATAGGNGSEGMPYYYGERFYTQTPFDAGNCDLAIQGDVLCVNYARHMYSGHQANTVFVVNTKTMEVQKGITTYNSHSFDQRVTPYSKTGGFLLESQGDCFDRAFTTSVTGAAGTLNEMNTFDFWVEPGTYDDYNMSLLNVTRARLGNILETKDGAMLVAASARSLSADADGEPYDVFVQVFDPQGSANDPASYVTTGERSGLAGPNGDQAVVNYGVQWLTDFASSKGTTDVVQAVSAGDDKAVVLYELYGTDGWFRSSSYMLLNGDGSVSRGATDLGDVTLNTDEDPVYAQGAVQWVTSDYESGKLLLHSLCLEQGQMGAWFKEDYEAAEAAAAQIAAIGAVTMDSGEVITAARKAFDSLTEMQKKMVPDRSKKTLTESEKIFEELVNKHDPGFTDVHVKDYFWRAVVWAVEEEITKGTSTTSFSPNTACTRAQAVTFLWRAAGAEKAAGTNPFLDVSKDAYYYDAVLWAYKNGITTGTSETAFGPDNTCSRGQIVTFLWRSQGQPEAEAAVSFKDVDSTVYYYEPVRWAVEKDVTKGTSETTFSPDDFCTRGQIVTFLYRALGRQG